MGAYLPGNLASSVFAQDPFIGSVLFFVLMGGLLLALGGLLLYLRKKQGEDE